MKYRKGTQTTKLDDLKRIKGRLHTPEDGGETPWFAESPDGKEKYLLNHAVCFYPYPSWGAVFDNARDIDVTSIREKAELTLHADAWDQWIANGIIDEEGNLKQVTQ